MNITGMLPQVNCLSFLEAKSDLQTRVSGGQITDSDDVLKLKVVSSAHVSFRTESVLLYVWNSLLSVL